MLIKISNRRRLQPRGPADLRRLLRYLFKPKMTWDSPDEHRPARHLGPPLLHRLITSDMPWGASADKAADDLTEQMVRYCQAARAGKPEIDPWYVHIIVSFSPKTTPDLAAPPDPHKVPRKANSIARNALRLTFDALDFLGWGQTQPGVFVVHGDRQHVHVHAVIVLPVKGGDFWDVMRFSRREINQIARICSDAFELTTTRGDTARKHQKRWAAL